MCLYLPLAVMGLGVGDGVGVGFGVGEGVGEGVGDGVGLQRQSTGVGVASGIVWWGEKHESRRDQ